MIPDEILDIQAQLCQAMGHLARLKIVHCLREGAKSVNEISALIGYPQATTSRQLGILRNAGIVVADRHGTGVYYHIANPKIMTVCDLMREVLTEQLNERSKILGITRVGVSDDHTG